MKYTNFAWADSFTIYNVQTARETKKYTMQFWMYAYNYKSNTFGGVTWVWKGHNKIVINGDITSGRRENEYKFICYPNEENSEVISSTFIINQWNFLSCATNYKNNKKYLNLIYENGENPPLSDNLENNNPSSILQNNDKTNLTFTDNSDKDIEWGVLYFNQIRLWKEAYFNTDFISRVEIVTKSLFPKLLHAWNGYYGENSDYSHNLVLTDIDRVLNHTFDSNPEQLGLNYVTIEPSSLTLCDEVGKYYDALNNKCLQFTDVSKIDSLIFDNVPNSYSGSYSMSFWIFLEDATSINSGIHITWQNHLQISLLFNKINRYLFSSRILFKKI